MMRECASDVGNAISPSFHCGGSIYYSPDIWVRQNPDGGTVDQAPIANQSAYVYVRLHNRGNQTSSCGVLALYYKDATPSNGDWPTGWINFVLGGVIRANVIDHLDVCAMAPNETRIVMIEWPNVQANIGVHHCLLARWISSDDPMQNAETWNVYMNVLGNNNIAHRNCQPVIVGTTPTPLVLTNTKPVKVLTSLKLVAVDGKDGGNDIFDDIQDFTIKLTFDADTFTEWLNRGKKGRNIEALPNENAIRILKADASIDELTLPDADNNDRYSEIQVGVELQFPEEIPAGADEMYVWTLEQHNQYTAEELAKFDAAGHPAPFDGVAFEIYTAEEEGDGAARRNLDPVMDPTRTASPTMGRPELTARPNILNGSTQISYTLPESAEVSLVIHDINGRPVRTLLSGFDASAGNHQVEWDGKATDGTLIPAGTYFYRLITPDGAVERQLKIVR